MTLNTVYYLSQPVENIPYEFFLEFLPQSERDQCLKTSLRSAETLEAGRDGKYSQFTALAIPVCLGDYLGPFRVVGTTTNFFDDLTFGPEGTRNTDSQRAATFSTTAENTVTLKRCWGRRWLARGR